MEQWTRIEGALGACILGAIVGCGPDGGPAPAPDAGGPGRRPEEEQCLRAEALEPVLSPRALGGAPMGPIVVDGAHVYFSLGTRLYRVPKDGGQAEELFSDASSLGLAYAVQDGRVWVATDSALFSLGAAGDPQRLTELPEPAQSDLFTAAMPFVFAGNSAYFASTAGAAGGAHLYAVDLGSGLSTLLGEASDDVWTLVEVDGALYWTESSAGPSAAYENVLLRLPVGGGSPEEVDVELGSLFLAFDLLGATSGAVVLDVSLVLGADNRDDAAVTASGIYRQPVSGGTALQLVQTSALTVTDWFSVVPGKQALQVEDQLFLRVGALQRTTIYSLAKGGQEPETRLCVELGEAVVESMTVEQGAVYLGMAVDGNSSIVRHEL